MLREGLGVSGGSWGWQYRSTRGVVYLAGIPSVPFRPTFSKPSYPLQCFSGIADIVTGMERGLSLDGCSTNFLQQSPGSR